MIVTDDAKQELKKTLSQNTDDPEICLRLTAQSPGELGLTLDTKTEDDQVVEHEGSDVLLIGKEIADKADNLKLDTEHTEQGERLVVVPV